MIQRKTNSDREIIMVIAEWLTNEFGKVDNVVDKATRLYNIMKLEKSEEEIQVDRIREDLKQL